MYGKIMNITNVNRLPRTLPDSNGDGAMRKHELRSVLSDNLKYLMRADPATGKPRITGKQIEKITVNTPAIEQGVSQAAISHYLHGKRAAGLDHIQALSDALNVPRSALLIPGGAKLVEETGMDLLAIWGEASPSVRKTIIEVSRGMVAQAKLRAADPVEQPQDE